jgi:hypothetical protein
MQRYTQLATLQRYPFLKGTINKILIFQILKEPNFVENENAKNILQLTCSVHRHAKAPSGPWGEFAPRVLAIADKLTDVQYVYPSITLLFLYIYFLHS